MLTAYLPIPLRPPAPLPPVPHHLPPLPLASAARPQPSELLVPAPGQEANVGGIVVDKVVSVAARDERAVSADFGRDFGFRFGGRGEGGSFHEGCRLGARKRVGELGPEAAVGAQWGAGAVVAVGVGRGEGAGGALVGVGRGGRGGGGGAGGGERGRCRRRR